MLPVAVHEAGRAVLAATLRPGSVKTVSMAGPAGAGGDTHVVYRASSSMRDRNVSERLRVILAGRAAEQLLLGRVSSASGGPGAGDLGLATELAIRALATYGPGSARDPARRGGGPSWPAHESLSLDPGLAEEVRSRLEAAYSEALDLLRHRLVAVVFVAAALLRAGHLDGPAVKAIMLAHPGNSR